MLWKKNLKCPIEEADKAWIQEKLQWIDKKVIRLKNQDTVLPTQAYFNTQFTGTEEDAHALLKRIGELTKVNTSPIQLGFYSEENHEIGRGNITQNEGMGSAGKYIKLGNTHSILIEKQQLKRPESLIATLAHEMSHYVLLEQKKVFFPGKENEWLTDLLAVAYGFGIFMGNSKFEFSQWQSGDGWGGWGYSIQGYLPQQIIAFAMADIEVRRSDTMPSWVTYLTKDFKKDFKKSFNYLLAQQTNKDN